MTTTTGCPPWCSTGHGQLVGEDDAVHVGEVTIEGRWRVRLCCEDDDEVRLLLDECELGVADLPRFQAGLHRLCAEVDQPTPDLRTPRPAAAAVPPPDC